MATHRLKTWLGPFEELKAGKKTFEWRKADRDFRVGDRLVLQKFDPTAKGGEGEYMGEELLVVVSHVMTEGFEMTPGFCILSIKNPVYYAAPDKGLYISSLVEDRTPIGPKGRIPLKGQNPEGLHQKYVIKKVKCWKRRRTGDVYAETEKTDPNADYFVLRLDDHGNDKVWVKACRKAMLTIAEEVRDHLPELAKDILSRYK